MSLLEPECVVNGVTLPPHVIHELRMLGMPLAWYNAGELQDAVNACAVDCELIDDPDGVNFRDMLNLTPREIELRRNSPMKMPKCWFFEDEEDEMETEPSWRRPRSQPLNAVMLPA